MNKGIKIIGGILGAIGLGVGTYYTIKYFSKPSPEDKKAADTINDALKDTVGSDETTTLTKIVSDPFPLKITRGNNRGGSEGLNVGKLQLALNYLYNAGLTVDGKMGGAVQKAAAEHLPTTIYNKICRLGILYEGSCDIEKGVYDYLLNEIVKKDKVALKFVNYVLGNPDYKKLLSKYK